LDKRHRFSGYDWTELSELWGIPATICGDTGRLDATREFMEKSLETTYTANLVGEHLRQLLMALAKEGSKTGNNEDAKIWTAIAEIKSNEKLILYCRGLLEYMWT